MDGQGIVARRHGSPLSHSVSGYPQRSISSVSALFTTFIRNLYHRINYERDDQSKAWRWTLGSAMAFQVLCPIELE